MTAERRMDRLARRNDFKLYTLETPLGTSTLNSRQSATIAALAGATEVIIIVKVNDSGNTYEHHFTDYGGDNYSDFLYNRAPDSNYVFVYDVQWIKASNEVNIRFNYKGSSFSGYPKIYAVMYR